MTTQQPTQLQPFTPETWKPFERSTWEEYIRWDLAALEDPNRRDHSRIFEELRFNFTQYGRTFKTAKDWIPAQ